tara:strand:+ start:2157 stop:3410 length:1254 start_codon:yes stop_codon:yes gene_type:complete
MSNNLDNNKLNLITRDGGFFNQFFIDAGEKFRKLHNEKFSVNVVEKEVHSLYLEMVKNNGMLGPEYDLMNVVTDWFPEIIDNNLAVNLNEFIIENPIDGWPDAWPKSLMSLQEDNGNFYGIPFHDGPEVMIIRKDLFNNLELQKSFEDLNGYQLSSPKTWDQFIDIAKFFNNPKNEMWGTIIAGLPDAHNNVYDFLIQLWSRGGNLLDKENKYAVFNNDIGEEALEFNVDLIYKHKVVPKEALSMDSGGSGFFFADGKAAMMWNWIGFASMAQTLETSKVKKNIECHLIPTSSEDIKNISLNVYWTTSIASGSKNKSLAYDFLKFCASDEMDLKTTTYGLSGVRKNTWKNPNLLKTNPEYSIMERSHDVSKTMPKITKCTEVIEILNLMVDDALNLKKSPKDSIEYYSEKINKLLDK